MTQFTKYSLQPAERNIEPITTLRGTRVYLHMKPFVLVPNITLTIGLFSEQREDQAIGEVLASREGKKREVEIGQAQGLVLSSRYDDCAVGMFLA